MDDGAEPFGIELIQTIEPHQRWRYEMARCGHGNLMNDAGGILCAIGHQLLIGGLIDDRADIVRWIGRIAHHQFAHCANQHLDRMFGYLLLQQQKTQRRATLAGRLETGNHDIAHNLLRKGRRIDKHRIEPPRFGNQRNEWASIIGQ